jgi:predicted esterase
MAFSTEAFVAAVVEAVSKTHKIDRKRVHTLSWSSGGPAAYAASLEKSSPVRGSFVAMSVFKPDLLPSLTRARGHAYYILHSPQDDRCPLRMAEEARDSLRRAKAKVEFVTYSGGHGWHGDKFGMIRRGLSWLDENAR